MPTPMSLPSRKVYLGIDPGAGGGLAALWGETVTVAAMPKTEKDVWDWLNVYEGIPAKAAAIIEQIDPRPTMVYDHELKQVRPRILKSSCLLYGDYLRLRAFLVAASIPFEECPPQRWQKGLKIPPREKGEEERNWKNRLKAKAQQLFPREKVTLATADSLLIAEYCRRKEEGKL